MNEAGAFWFVTGTFLGLALANLCFYLIQVGKRRRELRKAEKAYDRTTRSMTPQEKQEYLSVTLSEQEPAVKIPGTNEFSVSGKPRTVPWHIRRRELEAAARTKREKLESFRDV